MAAVKRTYRILISFIVASAICLQMSESITATSYSDLQDAQNEKKQAEDGANRTQDQLDDLNEERADLQNIIDELNEELQIATGDLINIESLIEEKEANLEQMQADLEEAKNKEAEQYEAMKNRIQFMYERGDSAYIEMYFSSKSISDFLNKSEYVEQLAAYDRKMLEDYANLQVQIQEDETYMVDERASLDALKLQAIDRENEALEKVAEAASNLSGYADEIAKKEKELLDYEREIEEKEYDIAKLQAEVKKNQALSAEAASAGFQDLSGIQFSAGDLDLMAAIIECEAGGESYTGKVAVGNVVMNRVASPKFPNTVLEVIYQNKQFSPVGSGRFAVVLARGANASCYQAAQDAMNGAAPVGQRLFFRTPIPGLTGMQIGGHIFY